MKIAGWFGAGLIAALVGAGVWTAVSMLFNIEAGIIAWGIGVLAGVAVRAMAKEDCGLASGVAAVLAAIIGVGCGRTAVVALLVMGGQQPTKEDALVVLADVVARERQRAGERLRWPMGQSAATAEEQGDFPPGVWAEAERRWDGLSPDEQRQALQTPGSPRLLDTEFAISTVADRVAEEMKASGRTLTWPEHRPASAGMIRESYPQEVWKEAESRWTGMSADQRAEFVADDARMPTLPELIESGWFGRILIASLSLWDALWLGLASVSAFRIGSGSRTVGEA